MSSLPKSFGVLLYDSFAILDAFGPLAFFFNLPKEYDVKIHFIGEKLEPVEEATRGTISYPVAAKTGARIMPTHTLENAPPLDVLVIPGGCSFPDERWSRFVKERYPTAKYIFSVCTGTIVLVRSGLIDGRRATTNKSLFKEVASFGPRVDWVPSARWVTDGNIWTASGVEAGTDQAYAFVTEVYGVEVAKDIASRLELEPQTDPSLDPFAVVYKHKDPNHSDVGPSNVSTTIPISHGPGKHYGIVLYPGFEALDVVSLFEYIQSMSTFIPLTVSFIAQTLDPVAPGGTIPLPKSFIPTHTFENSPSTPLDVLIIPGSGSATNPSEVETSGVIKFIQSVYASPELERIITVSTGSLLAASAGLLDNRRATIPALHWNETKAYPLVKWARKARYVVSEGEGDGAYAVYSASGPAAGLDLGYKLMVDMYGEKMAKLMLKVLEYTPHEDSEWDPWAEADA